MASTGASAAADPLAQVGFTDLGGRRYRHEDMILDARGSWWTLSCPATKTEDWLWQPGLWKLADADGAVQALDLPARALDLEHTDLPELMSWAVATRCGQVQLTDEASTQLPEVELHELTARVSTFTCQGKVVVGGGRLYVDFPLPAPPKDLSATAWHWLHATLVAARRLRMVRVEACGDSGAIHARVDLTGAPSAWRAGLFAQGIGCLRAAVEQLLPAITFLTTAGVTCRALELGAPAPASTSKTSKTNKTNKTNKTKKDKEKTR